MTRWWPRSLFAQLALAQLSLLAVLALVLPVLVLLTLHRTADDYVAALLRHDADIVATSVATAPAHRRDVALRQLSPLYGDRGSRAYRITTVSGQVLAEGGLSQALPPPLVGNDAPTGFTRTGKLDMFRRSIDVDGGHAMLEIAQDRTRPEVIVDDVVSTFLQRALWIVPGILAVSVALALVLVARVTRHLRDVSEQADHMALGARLETAGLPIEAQRLASATNRALDRVEEGYRRQSAFVSSVAHELRTPLTLVALRSDALPPSPERTALREAIDQASHVVSQLMELAAIEGRPPAIDPLSIEAVAQSAVAATAPLVFRSGRSIELTRGEADPMVTGNAGLLHIAIANLIDNAVRHTPPGTTIVVHTERNRVAITDNGPGILIERRGGAEHYRSTGQQRSDSAGLGLSIVSRIMAAMDGTLEVREPAAGAEVVLHLARRAPDPA